MRAPTDTRDQKTARYLATVTEMEHYADLQRFEGAGSFYAWERLNLLIGKLRDHYDLFELEGDAGPVRREVERFQADLGRLQVKPDAWVAGRLSELLDCLEEPVPVVSILTSVIPAVPLGAASSGFLAIKPEDLQALLERRTQT